MLLEETVETHLNKKGQKMKRGGQYIFHSPFFLNHTLTSSAQQHRHAPAKQAQQPVPAAAPPPPFFGC